MNSIARREHIQEQDHHAEALRLCARILVPLREPWARNNLATDIEEHIKTGTWPLSFNIKEISLLFYPRDEILAGNFALKMMAAVVEKELLEENTRPFSSREYPHCTPTQLAAWKDCPPVPRDSPLRFWLPEWMREAGPAAAKLEPVPVTTPSIEAWRANARQIGEKFHTENPRWNAVKIAQKTHYEMTARKDKGEPGMTGRGGRVPCADSIKRHAQTGITR